MGRNKAKTNHKSHRSPSNRYIESTYPYMRDNPHHQGKPRTILAFFDSELSKSKKTIKVFDVNTQIVYNIHRDNLVDEKGQTVDANLLKNGRLLKLTLDESGNAIKAKLTSESDISTSEESKETPGSKMKKGWEKKNEATTPGSEIEVRNGKVVCIGEKVEISCEGSDYTRRFNVDSFYFIREPNIGDEVRLTRKDGEIIEVSFNLNPIIKKEENRQSLYKLKLDKYLNHIQHKKHISYDEEPRKKESRQDIRNYFTASKNENPVVIEAKSYSRLKYIGQVTNITNNVEVTYSKGDEYIHIQNIGMIFFEIAPNIGDIVEFTIQNREIIEVNVQKTKLNQSQPISDQARHLTKDSPISSNKATAYSVKESPEDSISKHFKMISSHTIPTDLPKLNYIKDFNKGNSVSELYDPRPGYFASTNPTMSLSAFSSSHLSTSDLIPRSIYLNSQENEEYHLICSISRTETLNISPPKQPLTKFQTSISTNTCSNYKVSKTQHISIPSPHHHDTISTFSPNSHQYSISQPLTSSSPSSTSSSSQSTSSKNLIVSLLTFKLKTVAEHRLPIFSLHLVYSENIQYHTRVSSITSSFQSWRRLRVDSNSFYRAIGVTYLEHLFTYSTSISEVRYFLNRIDYLISTLSQNPEYTEILSFRNNLSELCNYKIRIGSAILILQDYLIDISFNRSMILSLRYLAYYFLQHAVSIDSSSYLDSGNFTLVRIRDMNEEAEREEYSLMAETLGVKIENYSVYKEVKVEEFSPRMARHICTTIKLLQKGSHFDILYTREDNIRDGYDPEGMRFRSN